MTRRQFAQAFGAVVAAVAAWRPINYYRFMPEDIGNWVFMDIHGDDRNDGRSEETAVATMERAQAISKRGSVIAVGPGTYTITSVIRRR